MNRWCVVIVTFGEPYDEFQPRLLASLDVHWRGDRMIWTGKLPDGAPSHSQCPFGFKLYAIKAARDAGHRGVVWMDGGGYLTGPVDPLLERTSREGCYIVEGTKPLSWWVSEEAARGMGVTRGDMDLRGWKLCGGTPYAFDFDHPVADQFFRRWWHAMEAGHFRHVPGDGTNGFHGSRHDESIASILMYQLGITPQRFGEFYVGDEKDSPTSFIRSGHAP